MLVVEFELCSSSQGKLSCGYAFDMPGWMGRAMRGSHQKHSPGPCSCRARDGAGARVCLVPDGSGRNSPADDGRR